MTTVVKGSLVMTDAGEVKATLLTPDGTYHLIDADVLSQAVLSQQLMDMALEASNTETQYTCVLLYVNKYGNQVRLTEKQRGIDGGKMQLLSLASAVSELECTIDLHKRQKSNG